MLTMKMIMKDITREVIKNIREFKLYLILFFLYILFFRIVLPNETNCLIKITTGFPCPTCGMTRAVFSLLAFDIVQAFYFHPLVFLLPILVTVVVLRDIYFFKYVFYSKVFWAFVIVLFIVVYVVRMILYFPDTAPLDFNYRAFI